MMTSRLFNSAEVSFHCPTKFSNPSHRDVPESLRTGSETSAGGVIISDAISKTSIEFGGDRADMAKLQVLFSCRR
jgi:hypothetical protein